MRSIYQARRELFVDLLRRECSGLLEVEAPDAGMNLIAWLPAGTSDRKISQALREEGLETLPLSSCVMTRRLRPGLLLGFSGIREPDLRDGVGRLARQLERLIGRRARR